jgi:zinc protease
MARPRIQHCLLAILVLATSISAQSVPDLHVPYRLFRLENGLTVILHQDRSVPVAAVNVWYHVGSANEKPGRTGFAHLFEHLMFEGSEHVQEGEFDTLLEGAGGSNNGNTTNDYTQYYEDMPSNALELALFLESDRMGFLLPPMTPARVDGQRDVVKNERRQSYENQPYGMASLAIDEMVFPKGHPYHWPVIGYMEDLTAASHADVVEFFKKYYAPNNASLVVAGDIDLDATEKLVRKWFSNIPKGPPVEKLSPQPPALASVQRKTITDRVQLPRLYLAWPSPKQFGDMDAALDVASQILGGGKNSRLYKRLVYDTQMAQDVVAYQNSMALAGQFLVMSTARPGKSIADIQKVIDEELARMRDQPPDAREMERALNSIEATFYRGMERVGSYSGKASRLNAYYFATGEPDYFAKDLARYKALTPADVQKAAARWLPADKRAELIVEPEKTK